MKRLLTTTALLCGMLLDAASPVTHIVMAEKWMKVVRSFEGKQCTAFLSGNLFPDIRYLGVATRAATHEAGLLLEDALFAPTPFRSGMKLHAWLDEAREELVVAWNIYDYVEEYAEGNKATLLKMVEDEILFERLSKLDMIREAIHVVPDEKEFGISSAALVKWHLFLTLYFSCRPSTQMALLAKYNQPYLNIPPETVKRWSQIIPRLAAMEELQEYTALLEEIIEERFTEFKATMAHNLSINGIPPKDRN